MTGISLHMQWHLTSQSHGSLWVVTLKMREVAITFVLLFYKDNFDKNCLGHILGDFFRSSSGPPAHSRRDVPASFSFPIHFFVLLLSVCVYVCVFVCDGGWVCEIYLLIFLQKKSFDLGDEYFCLN
jgi:hypothetical protein